MKLKILSLFTLLLLTVGASLTYSKKIPTSNWIDQEVQILEAQAKNLNPQILKLSLNAYLNAQKKGLVNKQLLTIIDYSKPSTERRLWVIDLKNDKVLFNTWVSHGKNSGSLNAHSFSNKPGSLKSSIGVFTTSPQPYVGHSGYSLRLNGHEPGINDNAFDRAIVMHGARYVSEDVIKKYGLLGRSWGCPAVKQQLIKPIIDTIKGKTIIVAYYPDQKWLKDSDFLNV